MFCRAAAHPGRCAARRQRSMLGQGPASESRPSLDAAAGLLSPAPVNLRGELTEHVQQFNLFGDPLLSLHHPQELTIEAGQQANGGPTLHVACTSPCSGRATVELITGRDQLRFERPPRQHFPATAAEAAELGDTYRKANDPRWSSTSMTVIAGQANRITLPIPPAAEGECQVRVFVSGDSTCAAGATGVEIRSTSKH